jgi:hypothetical protein
MPTAEGLAVTPRAGRYLVQFCRHAGRMRSDPRHGGRPRRGSDSLQVEHAEWSDTDGRVSLNDGVCTLRATPDALVLHIDASDDEALHRIQHLLTARLRGFGRRDALQVRWEHPTKTPPDQDDTDEPITGAAAAAPGRWRAPTAGAALAIALIVALHLGLVGALLAAPHWAAGAVELVVAVVAVKVLIVVFLGRRRRRTRSTPTG